MKFEKESIDKTIDEINQKLNKKLLDKAIKIDNIPLTIGDLLRVKYLYCLKEQNIIDEIDFKRLIDLYSKYLNLKSIIEMTNYKASQMLINQYQTVYDMLESLGIFDIKLDLNEMISEEAQKNKNKFRI